ncbi:MAG TPA: hypothetical protein PKC28_04880 [Bdellovibrionales bacterium]|nr:hypothetical protein [Bdellovibrionales bacterium]
MNRVPSGAALNIVDFGAGPEPLTRSLVRTAHRRGLEFAYHPVLIPDDFSQLPLDHESVNLLLYLDSPLSRGESHEQLAFLSRLRMILKQGDLVLLRCEAEARASCRKLAHWTGFHREISLVDAANGTRDELWRA